MHYKTKCLVMHSFKTVTEVAGLKLCITMYNYKGKIKTYGGYYGYK